MFFERERARLSTHKTPRVIACHEDAGESLLLPRGCLARVVDELERCWGRLKSSRDTRSDGKAITASFSGTLSPAQQAAVNAMAAHTTSAFLSPRPAPARP